MRILAIVLAFVLVGLVAGSVFIVTEGQTALVLQFGRIEGSGYAPGIHFKVPLVQDVLIFDQRVLNFDAPPVDYLTSEKKRVSVDFYVKWQIENAPLYYRALGADALGTQAQARLAPIIRDALNVEFRSQPLQELIAAGRTSLIDAVRDKANEATTGTFGIRIVDVRVKRIELPAEVLNSVYDRMRAERKSLANELRSTGKEAAERIKAEADRQAQVLRAEATRDAQKARGEGDARAAELYNAAYGKDTEFFTFYRSLEAYRDAFRTQNGVLVLDPKSEFLHYMQESK